MKKAHLCVTPRRRACTPRHTQKNTNLATQKKLTFINSLLASDLYKTLFTIHLSLDCFFSKIRCGALEAIVLR